MINKKTVLAALAAVLALSVAVSQAGEKRWKVGYTCPTLNNPFFVDMKNGAELAAQQRGIDLVMLGGDNNVNKQVQQVEDFIAQGVDVVIVQGVDTSGIATAVEMANEAGVPVMGTEERPDRGELFCYIAFDNVESGYNGGMYLGEKLNGKGKVVELIGELGQLTSRERSQGFQDAIKKFPGIEILSSQPANFDRARAMAVMENMLQTYDDIDGLYAANDEMLLGAAQAIEAAGRLGEIISIGCDGTDEALEAIRDGKISATNGAPGYIQGYIAIDIAHRYLKGEKVPEIIYEKNTVIDKSNLDQTDKILRGVSEEDWYWLKQF